MEFVSKLILWFNLLIWISLVFKGGSLVVQWGNNCPSGCQCQVTPLSQIFHSRRQHENAYAKMAFCIFYNEKQGLNAITNLPSDTQALTLLQAPDSSPITISGYMMNSLQKVKSIDMQGSSPKTKLQVTDDAFNIMHDLKYLSLKRIDMIGGRNVFAKLPSLEILQVVYCDLGALKWEMLEGLKSLKELYLVQSGIKELHDFAFYGAPELRRLFLSHNDLFSVEADAFVGLLKLEHLDLSYNRLDHLSGLTFPPMPHLQWLELKHNPIKVIFPHCFQYLNGTQHLTLGHRHQAVHLMKFSFRGLHSLIFLHIPNIDNDALTEHMFYSLHSLLHLNLQGRIKMLYDRSFNGAHRILQKLVLHDCKLEWISEDAFHGLHQLITLDLSSNLLKHLPEDVFEPLEMVQEIILSYNKFTALEYSIFQPLSLLQALRLDANPWNCSCDMTMWKEEMVIRIPQVISNQCTNKDNTCVEFQLMYSEDMRLVPRCEYPTRYQGQNVFDVLKIHLGCNNSLH